MGRARRHLTVECDRGVGTIQTIYIRRNDRWQRIGTMCLACHKLWPDQTTIPTDPTEIARKQTREGQAARDAILRRLSR